MTISPMKLIGDWDEGWALDQHTLKSEFLGQDIYGNDQFDTLRTDMGELMYMLKYRGRQGNVNKILQQTILFLDKWDKLNLVDVVIPVPPSRQRILQPVVEIAFSIAEHYKIGFSEDVLEKITTEESKNMGGAIKNLENTIIATKKAKRVFNVLLVDDLYSTGATLNECVKALREDPMLNKIYVLTMTATKKR